MIRARAGISYALTEAMDEGHCGLPTAELAQLAEEILRFRGLWSRRRSTSNWLRARSSLTARAKQTESSLPACTGPSASSRSGYCGWRTAHCHGSGSTPRRHLSCRTFAGNAVRLQLHALAYNLGNFLRTLATPEPIKDWSLTSPKEKLIKIGAKGRLPDGRSRHPTANVPGNFADDRRAAAAATSASVRRSMVMHSRSTDGGLRPNTRENQIRPSTPFEAPAMSAATIAPIRTSEQFRKSLQFTLIQASSGESRVRKG